MRKLTPVLLSLFLFFTGCTSIAPTPMQISTLVEKNDRVVELYSDCTEGANYVPEKETCDPELLEETVEDTMGFAKVFISGDLKQPQGYDVYLSTVMIYFRIAQRNGDEYSEAERIARQFFEIQKARSGHSLQVARFYWAAIAAARASWQWQYDRLALDADRKTDLLICLGEARQALTDTEWLDGPRRVRLIQYIQVLEAITNSID